MKILGLSGSLRAESVNTGLLKEARGYIAPRAGLEIYDYSDLPLFNEDLGEVESVETLKCAIREAHAVILAVPEYNYSMPGVLKNAIDYASRPAYRSVFRDKPVGVISAAASVVGGARGQQHTKTILLGMGAQVFPWPEFLVGESHRKFEAGVLQDQETRRRLEAYMEGFVRWVGGLPGILL